MSINWSILQPVDIGESFNRGFATGDAMRERSEQRARMEARRGAIRSAFETLSPRMGQPQQSVFGNMGAMTPPDAPSIPVSPMPAGPTSRPVQSAFGTMPAAMTTPPNIAGEEEDYVKAFQGQAAPEPIAPTMPQPAMPMMTAQPRQGADYMEAVRDLVEMGDIEGAQQVAGFMQQLEGLGKPDFERLRKEVPMMVDLIDNSTDQASYERNLRAAASYGFPVEGLPPQFDPAMIQQMQSEARALQGAVERKLTKVSPGEALIDERTGEPIFQMPAASKYHAVPEGGTLIEVGPNGPVQAMPGGQGDQSAPVAGADADAPAGDIENIWKSLVQQESGWRPGVLGPETPYGRAQGLTQMLPQTAQSMAQKLNVPWQPQMMTDTSPQGAAYQEQLGRAYFEEGLQKYGGDVRKALMYYHGGPDERIWGPKTRAYADAILKRVPGTDISVGNNVRVVASRPPKPEKPKFQAQRMSDAEVQTEGLDPNTVYYRNENGKPEAVSGQPKPTRQQTQLARQKISSLNAIEGQIRRVENAMKTVEKDGWTGPLAGLVPGRFDTESNVFDKAVAGLAPLIRQLTRVPGEGAMSDYESRLAEMTLPSRTDSPEGRREALASMRQLMRELRSGYGEVAAQPAAPSGSRVKFLGFE